MSTTQEQELYTKIEQADLLAVYAYAPMCGTCELAGKMLDVVESAVKEYEYTRINLNYYETFAEKYAIESVPCLLIFSNGELMDKIYAFQSVPYVYEQLQRYMK
ncbi:thioredoxin-like negative regulator of GroEL [Bacillus ectoiniformans]|uniref:thioredoxin family protein n=1 Tax=Bacillus ectoiniformans TaxID=1494429 RepID=UPI001EF91370|nr:thioredoxin family protein [Bacillus ectoiniformans]MBM7648580.1 thioredoxin-like negative regulator of GroEL [Bacillus ectoiniformans]